MTSEGRSAGFGPNARALTEDYPNKWISMGKDGVVSIGDSIEEVVAATEAKGVSTADVSSRIPRP